MLLPTRSGVRRGPRSGPDSDQEVADGSPRRAENPGDRRPSRGPEARRQGSGGRYHCTPSSSVREARERLTEDRFDLALCDIQMPGESGMVLVEELAHDYPETAVVLLTGVDDPGVAARAFELGAHGYLVKPFWPGQLLITVMSALQRRDLEAVQRARTAALEARLQTLMDKAPVPIYVKDRDRRYVLANRVAHEVAGVKPNALIGRTMEEVLDGAADPEEAQSDREVLISGSSREEVETIAVGGQEKAFLTVKFPYVDDRGQVVGITGIATDITDQRNGERLQRELAATQARAIRELRNSRQETVERLARAIEMHDAQTGEHVNRMARVASYLAAKIGLDGERVALLRTAAPMHDVGKIATPDRILRKRGPLTQEERQVMERHTVVGYELLSGSDSELLNVAATIALTHHERWDGSGYPRGLAGEEIPVEGRLVAVADVFDALLSDRCYRPAMSLEEAIAVVRERRGTHLDPTIVDVLLDNIDDVLAIRG